jgi:hypothetical protein
MTTASASGAARITSTGSPRSEPRSEVLEIPRTKRRRPTLNAFSAIEVLVPYTFSCAARRSPSRCAQRDAVLDASNLTRRPQAVSNLTIACRRPRAPQTTSCLGGP